MWTKLRKQTPIALDVGAVSLRAMQMAKTGSRISIRHWINQAAKPGENPGEKQGEASDTDEAIPGLRHERMATRDLFSGREVVTALGPPELEVCSLQIPESLLEQDHKTLLRSVRHEVTRHVNTPIETAELDVWPLAPGHVNGPNVMVGIAKRTAIEQLLEWITSQGYVCSRIDLAPLAVLRACTRMMDGLSADQLLGVLDIGFRASRLYIGVGQTPVYVRCIKAGGDAMTRRIAKELRVESHVAEQYKKHYGIHAEAVSYRPMRASQGPVDEKRMVGILHGTLTPILRDMARDIEKSFRYAMDLYPQLPVGGLVLIGGGANLKGLAKLLSEMLGIPVRCATAQRDLGKITNDPALADKVIAGMVTCLGLGFGELE